MVISNGNATHTHAARFIQFIYSICRRRCSYMSRTYENGCLRIRRRRRWRRETIVGTAQTNRTKANILYVSEIRCVWEILCNFEWKSHMRAKCVCVSFTSECAFEWLLISIFRFAITLLTTPRILCVCARRINAQLHALHGCSRQSRCYTK